MNSKLLLLTFAWVGSASASTSVWCDYMMLIDTYETLAHCSHSIQSDRLERFENTVRKLEQFIELNASAKDGRIMIEDYQSELREQLKQWPIETLCSGERVSLMLKGLDFLTTKEREQEIIEKLESPRDPFAGECI